jgi:hypothetical protein
MFPTFDIPPQHAETVGARKARRAKEEETERRASSATSLSSGSVHSAKVNSSKGRGAEKSGFGWFSKSSKKGVQEITSLPSVQKLSPAPQEPEPEIEPFPPTAPLPPPPTQDLYRKPSNRSDSDVHSLYPERHYPPPSLPPLRALPSRPPSNLSRPPSSPGLLSLPGMYCVLHLLL